MTVNITDIRRPPDGLKGYGKTFNTLTKNRFC